MGYNLQYVLRIDAHTYHPYLADYGLGCTREITSMGTAAVMGTAAYSAPEVFDCVYSTQTDIWALGCVLYELLTGCFIWNEINRKPMAIQRHFFYARGPDISRVMPSVAKDVVASCLQISPEKRPSADSVVSKLTEINLPE